VLCSVLWAKLAVFAAVTFSLMLASSVVSFFAVQAIVTQHHEQVTLGAPHALRALIGTALFLTVLGVLAVGLGGLVRNTAGAIASLVGLLFVLPGFAALLPSSTADAINPYLPLNAGFAVATSTSRTATTWLPGSDSRYSPAMRRSRSQPQRSVSSSATPDRRHTRAGG
jgi:ABC-2 type transport system permease protein